jgi:signal transduction histidine kinase
MTRFRGSGWGPLVVVGLGVGILLTALAHFAVEVSTLADLGGPLAALALDSVPALGLIYAGYWLAGSDLGPVHTRRIAAWCLVGGAVGVTALGLNMLIRVLEGRTVSEPRFTLLLSVDIGAVAGVGGGYYRERAARTARRAGEAADALSFVNSVVRHDLGNDLQVIGGQASLIEREADDERIRDRAARIDSKVSEAGDRIEETRTIAETLIGTAGVEAVDLAGIVREVAEGIEATAATDVRLDAPGRADVAANRGLRSVVDNLLENAVEHNDAPDPRVEVSIESAGDTVRMTVSDNGPGIPVGAAARLFDPPEDGSAGGLRIVGTLVRRYGGEIEVGIDGPRGSTVVVDLPAADAAA